jgi:phage host-nuclease inhibitor protein Gam
MATFQTQVEDIIGSVGDTAALTDWLTAGAKYITDLLPEEKFANYTTNISDGGFGVSVAGYRLLRAHKQGYKARPVDPGLKAQVADSDSIHYATTTDPVFYIENGTLYIKPSGGTGIGMIYPSVPYNAELIAGFPSELIHSVVLYACIRGKQRQISDKSSIVSAGTAPTALSAPSFTYSDVTAEQVSITKVIDLATQFTALGTHLDTDEDIDLANAKINEIRTRIEEFNTESSLALREAEFNAKNTTDVALQNELNDLQKQIQEYQSKVGRYSSELNKYQADINARVAEIQALKEELKSLQTEFDKSLLVLK